MRVSLVQYLLNDGRCKLVINGIGIDSVSCVYHEVRVLVLLTGVASSFCLFIKNTLYEILFSTAGWQ